MCNSTNFSTHDKYNNLHRQLLRLIPESPRWLLLAGKVEDARNELKRIAVVNRRYVDVDELLSARTHLEEENQERDNVRVGLLALLGNSKIRGRFLTLFYVWFVTVTLYFAVTLHSTDYSSDRFLNCLFPALVEFVGCFLGYLLLDGIGRPRTISLCLLIMGATSFAPIFLEKELMVLKSILALTGKAAGAAAFYIVFVITGELSPTMERGATLGVSSACSRMGGFLAPYLMYLGSIKYSIPYFVMAFLGLSSGIFSYRLIPESKGVKMPDSVEDSEANQRFYGWKFRISTANQQYPKETSVDVKG